MDYLPWLAYFQLFLTPSPHLVYALLLGVLALLFHFSDLMDLMSLRSLLANLVVDFSALVLRLSHSDMDSHQQLPDCQAFRLRLNYIIGFLVL